LADGIKELLYSAVIRSRNGYVYIGISESLEGGGSLDVALHVVPLNSLDGKTRQFTANGVIQRRELKDPVAQARVHQTLWGDEGLRALLPRHVIIILISNALIMCDL